MGQVRKIGDEYYIEFYARGLLYQQKGGKNRADALRLLEEIEGKIQQGEMGVIVRDGDIAIFFKTFLEYALKEHTPKTFTRYEATIRYFEQFLSKEFSQLKKLSEITPKVFEHYRAYLVDAAGNATPKVKPRGLNFTLNILRDIFDYSITLGYLNDNPTLHMRLVKVPYHKSPDIINDQELQDLFKHAADDFRDVLEFLVISGLLLKQLIALKWTDVDFDKKILKIKSLGSENREGKIRSVPMDSTMTETLNKLRDKSRHKEQYVFTDSSGDMLKKDRLQNYLDQVVKKSGLSDSLNFHWFRHTFARNLLSKGVSLADLYKLLGLSDIAKVMRYEGFIPLRDDLCH